MNAAICSPEPDQSINHVSDGKIEVSGYAYGAKGTPLKAVYVTVLPSTSSSESLKDSHERAASLPDSAWARAELETGDPVEGSSKNFAWTLWKAHVPVPTDHHGKIALVAWCGESIISSGEAVLLICIGLQRTSMVRSSLCKSIGTFEGSVKLDGVL